MVRDIFTTLMVLVRALLLFVSSSFAAPNVGAIQPLGSCDDAEDWQVVGEAPGSGGSGAVADGHWRACHYASAHHITSDFWSATG